MALTPEARGIPEAAKDIMTIVQATTEPTGLVEKVKEKDNKLIRATF